jgi:hypothetical protein
MNGTPYQTVAEWHETLIAQWRQEWLKAIDECVRPKDAA